MFDLTELIRLHQEKYKQEKQEEVNRLLLVLNQLIK